MSSLGRLTVEYNTCGLCPFIDIRHVLISLLATLMSAACSSLTRKRHSPAFDLPTSILLEYLLERFFEAGAGAKAV